MAHSPYTCLLLLLHASSWIQAYAAFPPVVDCLARMSPRYSTSDQIHSPAEINSAFIFDHQRKSKTPPSVRVQALANTYIPVRSPQTVYESYTG